MRRLAPAIVLLVAGCGNADRGAPSAASPPPELPATSDAAAAPDAAPIPSFNQRVVALARRYPAGGGYAWPAPRGTHGTRTDLTLGGDTVARGTGGPTHCSGITFELFWRALEQSPGGADATGLDRPAIRDLMRRWYVPTDRGQGPADALTSAGLGRRIADLEEAIPGDFVQVWMNNGRGHTMIFLDWVRDRAGAITGIRHFSSHPSTDGAGIATRAIGDGPRDIDRDAIHVARATVD